MIVSRRWLRSLFGIFLILALLAGTTPTQAQSEPPTLEAYIELLRAASAAAQRSDRLGLEDIANQLIATTEVQITPDQRAPANNQWLAEALRPADPDYEAIEARLGAIINALAQPAGSAPANALERLKNILSNPPFAERQEEPTSNWLSDFFNWLGRVLDTLLRPVGSAASTIDGQLVAWIIGIIGSLLLVAVVIYLIMGLRRSMVRNVTTADDDPEAHLTARTALDQASEIARAGDHRTAMRYLYLSALLWLDERDMLRYDRALTNREYLESVRDKPALRSRLQPIVDTFDRVWYGHAPLDDAAFAAYRAQVEALRSEVKP